MTNPSTVWTALSSPASPVGSIPFVYSDSVTIQTQVANLWFDQVNGHLSVGCASDQSGTDSVNTYYNFDSYWPYNVSVATPLGANGSTAGFSVSTSRGTGSIPVINQSGDFVGKFSGWAYSGAAPTYQELAGITIYTNGVSGAGVGIGGELRLFSRQDGVLLPVEWIKLSTLGNLQPVVDNTSKLGFPSYGFSGLFLSYTIAGVAGAQTIHKPAGKVLIAAGQSSVVVTNNLVSASTIVHAQLETVDATALYIKAVNPAAGSFTITLAAAATLQVTVSFIVFRTDT